MLFVTELLKKKINLLYKHSFLTSQRTHHVSSKNTNRGVLYGDIMIVYFQNKNKHTHLYIYIYIYIYIYPIHLFNNLKLSCYYINRQV